MDTLCLTRRPARTHIAVISSNDFVLLTSSVSSSHVFRMPGTGGKSKSLAYEVRVSSLFYAWMCAYCTPDWPYGESLHKVSISCSGFVQTLQPIHQNNDSSHDHYNNENDYDAPPEATFLGCMCEHVVNVCFHVPANKFPMWFDNYNHAPTRFCCSAKW